MSPKFLYLPTFVYSASFLLVFVIYKFGWSDLYPNIEGPLFWFLLITIFFSFVLSLFQRFFLKEKQDSTPLKKKFIYNSLLFIITGYIMEFLYEGGVPLISTLLNSSFSYKDFTGIPTFHVVLSTYNIFFSILIFEYFLMNNSKRNFLFFFISLLPFILVMNRGALIIVFSSLLFVFLMKTKSISSKILFKIAGVFLVILFFFGVVGNVRQEQSKEDKEYLLRIGGASEKFIKSNIPIEFYWSYIYIISPLGNLQNIVKEKSSEFEIDKLPHFISTELLPDFISKRVSSMLLSQDEINSNESQYYLVTPLLNAPTTYYSSYLFLGYSGLVIMYSVIMFSACVYPQLLSPRSAYYVTGIASLNSIILLGTFNNMWFATGTILFWPFIMEAINRIKFRS